MTLPIYLAVHVLYGMWMARIFLRRMQVEGEVLGVPVVFTFLPVGLVTIPLGAVLLRFAGGWFLHGAFIGDGSIAYERFHLGFSLAVGLGAAVFSAAGFLWAVAMGSRSRWRDAVLAPAVLAALLILGALILDARGIFVVAGTNGRLLFAHPAGLVSLAIVAVLAGSGWLARAKLQEPPVTPGLFSPSGTFLQGGASGSFSMPPQNASTPPRDAP